MAFEKRERVYQQRVTEGPQTELTPYLGGTFLSGACGLPLLQGVLPFTGESLEANLCALGDDAKGMGALEGTNDKNKGEKPGGNRGGS